MDKNNILSVLGNDEFSIFDAQINNIRAIFTMQRFFNYNTVSEIEQIINELKFLKGNLDIKHKYLDKTKNVTDVREYIISYFENLESLISAINRSDENLINKYSNEIMRLLSCY